MLENVLQRQSKSKVQRLVLSKFFSKCCQKYVFNLLIRVEVGSDISIIGSTFHKREALLKKK